VPGDYGWIIHKQGLLYAREYGWDLSFEALVADIVSKFSKEFVPGREKCWVAEREGEVIGSVFIVRQDDTTAKLRLLYVDPSARGLGLGRRLVSECIRFARNAGYRRMTLWTNDILVSARRIYEAEGFTLIEQEAHHSFGKDLIGQNWSLDL
jgi:GNAT superfamily N-acetyltransferase